jgi:hypothetical protein
MELLPQMIGDLKQVLAEPDENKTEEEPGAVCDPVITHDV